MHGVVGFGLVFFAIWWAWMGFAWFASAFDTDDTLYRVKAFVQIVGILVLAAGVPRAFENRDFSLITFGYAIMRLGLIAQWLRAAYATNTARQTAYRYAVGIAVLQLGWLALLAVPIGWWIYGWMVLAPLELLVPWWAEKAGETTWHPHHIAERYGLFTIIVIGESVLAATVAIQSAIDLGEAPRELVAVIVGAPVILFTMWWLYFSRPAHTLLTSSRAAFAWGYGHFFVFSSAAGVGSGLAVLVDHATGEARTSAFWVGQSLAIPVATFLVSVWLVHVRRSSVGRFEPLAFLVASLLVLAAPLTNSPAIVIATLLLLLTAVSVLSSTHRPE